MGLSGTDTNLPFPNPNGVAGTYSVGGVKQTSSDIVKAISCISAFTGGTNLATPIEMAQWYLDHFGRANAAQGILLETDGHPQSGTDVKFTCGETVAAATAAKNDKTKSPKGIKIYTVGYGVDNSAKCPIKGNGNSQTYNANELAAWSGVAATTFLQTVATSPANYYANPSSADLASVFTEIATDLAKNPAQLVQIYSQPVVTNVSPTPGSHLGGKTVTITGKYLTGATQVTFGGTPAASFTVNSDTQITAISPAGTTGNTVDIIVTTGGGSSLVVPADQYKYN